MLRFARRSGVRIQPPACHRDPGQGGRAADLAAADVRLAGDRRQRRHRHGRRAEGLPRVAASRRANVASLTTNQTARIAALNDEGKTVPSLVIDGEVAGCDRHARRAPPGCEDGLKPLTDAGIRTVMLTGDNRRTARRSASNWDRRSRRNCCPQDKQRIVGELQEGGLVGRQGRRRHQRCAGAGRSRCRHRHGRRYRRRAGDRRRRRTASAGSPTSPQWSTCRSARWATSVRTSPSRSGSRPCFLSRPRRIHRVWPAILADTGATVLVTVNALRLLRLPTTSRSSLEEEDRMLSCLPETLRVTRCFKH